MCYFTASEDCDTHSVTALACKSLNLSQALHEKCLHLELSSSDEDDTLRNLQVNPLYLHLTLNEVRYPEEDYISVHVWIKINQMMLTYFVLFELKCS